MAKLGTLRLKDIYDIYYFDEGREKFDHIHFKKGKGKSKQNIAEFWYTNLNRFIPKLNSNRDYLLEESSEKVDKKLREEGFIELVRREAMKTHGRVYPYIEKKGVKLPDLDKTDRDSEEDRLNLSVKNIGKLHCKSCNADESILVYEDEHSNHYLFLKIRENQYIFTKMDNKDLRILKVKSKNSLVVIQRHKNELYLLTNSEYKKIDFYKEIDKYLPAEIKELREPSNGKYQYIPVERSETYSVERRGTTSVNESILVLFEMIELGDLYLEGFLTGYNSVK